MNEQRHIHRDFVIVSFMINIKNEHIHLYQFRKKIYIMRCYETGSEPDYDILIYVKLRETKSELCVEWQQKKIILLESKCGLT